MKLAQRLKLATAEAEAKEQARIKEWVDVEFARIERMALDLAGCALSKMCVDNYVLPNSGYDYESAESHVDDLESHVKSLVARLREEDLEVRFCWINDGYQSIEMWIHW